ncbi:MAG: BBP7 family outer membrane beta-barrel protein [Planctomycetaceae bacterium]|nr:BBP7 family outer membrane beta-barrel protein [Planctomycetaceae bacterium]
MFSLKRLLLLFILLSFPFLACGVLLSQESFRPFRPYQPEEFGGARHSGDGFTFEISEIAWKVKGYGVPIGARDITGKSMSRLVYNGNSEYMQTNTLSTSSIGDGKFRFGTSYEIGFNRDHAGFLFRGYGISNLGGSFESSDIGSLTPSSTIYSGKNSGVFGSMVIDDSRASSMINLVTASGLPATMNYIWSTQAHALVESNSNEYLSPLTGWIPMSITSSSSGNEGDSNSTEADAAIWAPLPINFPYVKFSSSLDILSLELMYNYRPYPLKCGELNLYGGIRYFEANDNFNFTGISYGNPTAIVVSGSSDSDTSTSTSTDTTTTSSDDDDVPDITNLTTTINARVKNHITGPQVGAKLERRVGRWTFGAEGRLLAGFNRQTSSVSGKFATQFIDPGAVDLTGDGQVAPYQVIAFVNRPQAFYHKASRDVFSPAFELKLNVRWQWTDAVGFNVGFNSTVVDNIGRGGDVIDYRFNSDGSLFNIRKSNRTLTTHGVNFGISVRR